MICELKASQLRHIIDPNTLDIKSTEDIAPLEGVIGQRRAVTALNFGLGIQNSGFNLFVAGPPGIGKMSAIKSFLEEVAKQKTTPTDLCYVNNFADPYQPLALTLPCGRGQELQADMKNLIAYVRKELPSAFESEEYIAKRDEMMSRLNFQRSEILNGLNDQAGKVGFGLQITSYGVMTVPILNGEPVTEEKFESLPRNEREEWQSRHEAFQPQIRQAMKQVRDLERKTEEQLQKLDQQVALYVVSGFIEDLCEKYQLEPVTTYLKSVQADILENISLFRPGTEANSSQQSKSELALAAPWMRELPYRKYEVNVLVDNSQQIGAPVVVELNPIHANLVGRIEKESQFGALYTDFTMIKPGALHRANGGYLVLQIIDLLREVYSWDTLKRSLRSKQALIEELGDRLGFLTTKTLRPQPHTLDVKVLLVGPPQLYQLLHTYDSEFAELFKVRVDFDTCMPVNKDNIRDVIAFFSMICKREQYKPLDANAVARLLEQAMRMADDQQKLSTHFGQLADIVREANFWATQEASATIKLPHVMKALDQRIYRSSMVQEHLQELVVRNKLLIQTDGSEFGQINGLSVINLGDYLFGQPSRISASIEPGSKGILNIEREVEMSGPIHSKGVLILSGYLSQKYGADRPLTLSARLVFEQNYEGVEGDSASSTELYALLSLLARAPLRQDMAVTGSVNQSGEVQVIGGVNEKIEGFFDLCVMRRLTGKQGVLIPAGNVDNLMLREDLQAAVKAGKFHIWPVQTIDEGIEILTGEPAENIHKRVSERLDAFEARLKQFAGKDGKAENNGVTQLIPAMTPSVNGQVDSVKGN